MKLIYESKRPVFAIMADSHQWILARTKNRTKGVVIWDNRTFHPNISSLLDELAEYQFRNMAKMVTKLKDLEITVQKVYDLIDKVSNGVTLKK